MSLLKPFFIAAALSVFAAVSLRADESLLDRSLAFHGGYDSFLKLQSVLYEFSESRATAKGPVTTTGRHYFKFERGVCVAAQIETSSPEGEFLTIYRDGAAKLWRNGEPVATPALLENARGEALRNAFWLAAPQSLRRAGVPLEETGRTMIFEGASCRVYYASLENARLVPGVSEVRLYLDAKTGVVRGAVYAPADGKSAITIAYKDYDITGDLLVATQRVETKFGKTPARVFTLKKPKLKLGGPALVASADAVTRPAPRKQKQAATDAPAAKTPAPSFETAARAASASALAEARAAAPAKTPGNAVEFFAALTHKKPAAPAVKTDAPMPVVKPAPAPVVAKAEAPAPAPVVEAPAVAAQAKTDAPFVAAPVKTALRPAASADVPQTVRRARRDPVFLAMLRTPRARRKAEGSLAGVDMVNEGHRLRVVADLPGVREGDIQIFVVERRLTIRGVRPMHPLGEGQVYLTKERPLGSFVEEVELPFPVLSDKVEARLEQGVLTITLPRLQTAASPAPYILR